MALSSTVTLSKTYPGNSGFGSSAWLADCLSLASSSSCLRLVVCRNFNLFWSPTKYLFQTTYFRRESPIRPTPTEGEDNTDKKASQALQTPDMDMQHFDNAPHAKPPTFLRQLKIYNGTFLEESAWKIFLRPFLFIVSPVVRVTLVALVWVTSIYLAISCRCGSYS